MNEEKMNKMPHLALEDGIVLQLDREDTQRVVALSITSGHLVPVNNGIEKSYTQFSPLMHTPLQTLIVFGVYTVLYVYCVQQTGKRI